MHVRDGGRRASSGVIALVALAVVLSSCGGSGGVTTTRPATSTPEDTAVVSTSTTPATPPTSSARWTGTVHASRNYADSSSTSKLKWAGTASFTVDAKGTISGTFDVTGTVTSVTKFGKVTLPDTASWRLSGERTDNGMTIDNISQGAPNGGGSYFDEVVPNIPFTIPLATPDRIDTSLTPLLSGGTLQLELTCQTCAK